MSEPSVPVGPKDITAQWVSGVLGISCDIGPAVRIGENYGFASELYRVETDGVDPDRLIVKLWDTTTRAGDREIQFYKYLAPDCPLSLPVFRASGIDVATDRAFLIVDELVDVRQGDVTVAESRQSLLGLAQALAHLHARWWSAAELSAFPWLTDMQTPMREPDWFESRTHMFLERFGPLSQPVAAAIFANLAEIHVEASNVVRNIAPTLLHGDHHLDNIMFHADDTPVFLDWAGVGRGPGVLDLVNLAFRMGAVGDSQAALDQYFATLTQLGVALDRDVWITTVNAALLVQFTTWTIGMAAVNMPTERGSAILIPSILQAQAALAHWYERHPELLATTIPS